MNIRQNNAGYVTQKHIESKGFHVFETIEGSGMENYTMPQYKNDKIKILGGYWTYYITDMKGKSLWEGWWNSNEEFDTTIAEIESKLNETKPADENTQ